MSILACVIGTLTLMITALALGQIDSTQSPEVIARAEEHEQRLSEIKTSENEAEKLKRLLDEAAALREELKRALAELKRLEEQQKQDTKNADNSQKKKIQLLAEANKLQQLIDKIQADLSPLVVKIKRLQAELNSRKNPPKEAVVKIQPGGSGLNLDPTFVECTAAGVVLLESRGKPLVRRADLRTNKAFIALLDRVAKKPKGSVIFLVRSDAVSTYSAARGVARSRYCRNGKLPVLGKGRIDLSMFK